MSKINAYTDDKKSITTLKFTLFGVVFLFSGIVLVLTSFATFITEKSPLQEFLRSFGYSVLPAGILSIVYDLFIKRQFTAEVTNIIGERVDACFRTQITLLSKLEHTGIRRISDNFDLHSSRNKITKSKEISIMQTWEPNMVQWQKTIIDSIINGATSVRIILNNPNSNQLEKGIADLDYNSDHGKVSVLENTNAILHIAKNYPMSNGVLGLRYFDGLIPFSLYRADNEVTMGIFWHKTQSVNGPCFHFRSNIDLQGKMGVESVSDRSGNDMAEYLLQNFNAIWENSAPVILFDEPREIVSNQNEFQHRSEDSAINLDIQQ